MVLRGQLQRGKNSGGGWEGQWWWLSFEVYDQWHFRLMICYLAFSDHTNQIRDKYYLIILYLKSTWIPCRKERLGLVATGLCRSWIFGNVDGPIDRTAVFGLDRSWEFPVLIGLGPVQSRSFSSLLTGPSNTIKVLNCYFFPISGYSGIYSQKYMTSSQDINLISIKSKSMWYVFLYASTILLQNMLIKWVCGTWGKVAWQWCHNFYIRKWCLMT